MALVGPACAYAPYSNATHPEPPHAPSAKNAWVASSNAFGDGADDVGAKATGIYLAGRGKFGSVFVITDFVGKSVAVKVFTAPKNAEHEFRINEYIWNQLPHSSHLVYTYCCPQWPSRDMPTICLEACLGGDLFSYLLEDATGWEWQRAPGPAEKCNELRNEQLACALQSTLTFTAVEWNAFGITGLKTAHWIRVGDAYLRPVGRHSEAMSLKCLCQIAPAVQYLHDIDIAHCDIKPDNIFLDASRTILKLGDFGHSQRAPVGTTSSKVTGTMSFVAPEVAFTEIYNTPYDPRLADIWSLIVTAFVCAYGQCPFMHLLGGVYRDVCHDEYRKYKASEDHLGISIPPGVTSTQLYASMMSQSLSFYPLARPSLSDLHDFAHAYLQHLSHSRGSCNPA